MTVALRRPPLLVMFGTEFRRLEQAQPDIVAAIQEVLRQRLAVAGD